ncbi:hypothetical protein CDAR_42441 [Caerostris darwini]|uniref:Uncharacterized protein n=1 Tax=Caerostris darwini TaxID=1538125 RepID=A0AAV4RKT4_9ARAC|nr:hypothetical protein CDAR_42441 [Caerostris darwini]
MNHNKNPWHPIHGLESETCGTDPQTHPVLHFHSHEYKDREVTFSNNHEIFLKFTTIEIIIQPTSAWGSKQDPSPTQPKKTPVKEAEEE